MEVQRILLLLAAAAAAAAAVAAADGVSPSEAKLLRDEVPLSPPRSLFFFFFWLYFFGLEGVIGSCWFKSEIAIAVSFGMVIGRNSLNLRFLDWS